MSDPNCTAENAIIHANLIRLIQCILDASDPRVDEARALIAGGERWYWTKDAAKTLGICTHVEPPILTVAKNIIYSRNDDQNSRREFYKLIEFMLEHPLPGVSNRDAVFDTMVAAAKEVALDCKYWRVEYPGGAARWFTDFVCFATRPEVGATMDGFAEAMKGAEGFESLNRVMLAEIARRSRP